MKTPLRVDRNGSSAPLNFVKYITLPRSFVDTVSGLHARVTEKDHSTISSTLIQNGRHIPSH
jgi:hypothetical protein